MRRFTFPVHLIVVVGIFWSGFVAAQPPGNDCEPEWINTFSDFIGLNGTVRAIEVFDQGDGPVLFAGGSFTQADGMPASRLAQWNGSQWIEAGGGLNGTVRQLLATETDGKSVLIVAGDFSMAGGEPFPGIAKWDGSVWSAFGDGLNGPVRDLIFFDDGTGSTLYAGGEFTHSGDEYVPWLARWDGESWSTLPAGPNGPVRALALFDDGRGESLYVGGDFLKAGNMVVNRIAKWNGKTWSQLNYGVGNNIPTSVYALAAFDDGQGPALFVGGGFQSASGQSLKYLAKWNGNDWQGLPEGPSGQVFYLHVLEIDGSSVLLVAGPFTYVGEQLVCGFAKLDQGTWSPAGPCPNLSGIPFDVTSFEIEGKPVLVYAGSFTRLNNIDVNFVVVRNDNEWSPLGDPGTQVNDWVYSLEAFDDGNGQMLYAAGRFTRASGYPTNRIARWDGTRWHEVGLGSDGVVLDFHPFDDGSGLSLFAGGLFTTIDDQTAENIAKWNGEHWSSVGHTDKGGGFNDQVLCLTDFDDGSGPQLYAGGLFTRFGETEFAHLARWDGETWQPVGGGTDGQSVSTLAVFDDGGGPALFVGGYFSTAGNVPANSIARWDGTTWAEVGGGVDGAVYAMTVADLGDGPSLYAAGVFDHAGDQEASNIARWDGSKWTSLSGGVRGVIIELTVFDDGTGPALYAGGVFSFADGQLMPYLARWDGQTWSDIQGDIRLNGTVRALAAHNDGSGPALFVGGSFTQTPSGDRYIAKYQGCGPTTSPAPLTDFSVTLGTLLDGALDELIDSDDSYFRARSQFGFSAEEPNVLELHVGAVSPNVDASTIAATIESRLNHPNGAASVRLRNWSTNEFDEVHVYTIGTTEIIETIEGIEASSYIRATDGRIELAHRQVVLATFSALGFDAAIDHVELAVTN